MTSLRTLWWIMSLVTDYRVSEEKSRNGLEKGPMLPFRFTCYIRDLLRTWFGNPDNILDPKVKSVLYVPGDTPGAISKSRVAIEVAWPDDDTETMDQLPSCSVFSTQAQMAQIPSIDTIRMNSFGGVAGRSSMIPVTYDCNITVRTQSYALTSYLTEALFMYLTSFIVPIQSDAGVSSFRITGFTVAQLKDHEGNSKDVFDGTITGAVHVMAPTILDTVGTVFQHVTLGE